MTAGSTAPGESLWGRTLVLVAVVLGVVTAVLVIVQARLLSDVIVSVTSTGADWSDVRDTVVVIAAVWNQISYKYAKKSKLK